MISHDRGTTVDGGWREDTASGGFAVHACVRVYVYVCVCVCVCVREREREREAEDWPTGLVTYGEKDGDRESERQTQIKARSGVCIKNKSRSSRMKNKWLNWYKKQPQSSYDQTILSEIVCITHGVCTNS